MSDDLFRCLNGAIPLMLSQAQGGYAKSNGPNLLALSGAPAASLNVLFLGRESARFLSEGATLAAERKLPLLVLLSPEAAMLGSVAQALGLERGDDVSFMESSNPVERIGACEVARVDAKNAAIAARLQAAAFALPEASMRKLLVASLASASAPEVFIASRDGVPMSSVTVTRHGGAAGIWTLSTPPEHRRKGAARALLTRIMSDLGAQGVRRFYMLATQAVRPLCDSLGFEAAAVCQTWSAGRPTQVRPAAR
jgi:ribosomal protein S18 acetylase RimI-like enzyme